MILTINVDSEVPVYRQIVDALRQMLVEGRLDAWRFSYPPYVSLPRILEFTSILLPKRTEFWPMKVGLI